MDLFAIGHPLGQPWTATKGIVSATNRRNISNWQDLIQSVVAINSGNSGGPLFNMDGDIVGINTMIISPGSGGSVGLNFSVSSRTAKWVISNLLETGNVPRAQIGIMYSHNRDLGVIEIKEALAGTDASTKLRPGDVIVAVNDQPILNVKDLAMQLDFIRPGDTIKLTIKSNDELKDVRVKTRKFTKPTN
jgi:serine protease Do